MARSAAIFAAMTALCGIASWTVESRAAEDQANQNDAPLSYRRIFVPANDPAVWPHGEKFLPIESRDFKTWVEAANRTSVPPGSGSIDFAEYSGRLENSRL